MPLINAKTVKFLSAGTAFTLLISIAAQSLGTAQAQPLGYVQANCPAIVRQALDLVSAQCSKVGHGKACYGNSTITTELQPGALNVQFGAPGDLADVSQIKSLTLGDLDPVAKTWGIAELKIKADLPDSDVSQAVTMIMFGGTQILDADSDANRALLTQTPGALAQEAQYVTATTRAINQKATVAAVTATKFAGIEGTAIARANTPTATGTIPAYKATYAAATATRLANLIDIATAAPILQTMIPGSVIGPYSGLQAFYFQSGDSAACANAPHDGLLIQSPQGIKQRVTLNIDGTTISLGSTVFITAQPGKFLIINTLEGSALVTANNGTVFSAPGTAVQVALDPTLHPIGLPHLIGNAFYSADSVHDLPIRTLPTSITTAPGLPAADQGGTDFVSGILSLGRNYTTVGVCGIVTQLPAAPVKLARDSAANHLWFQGTFNMVLNKTASGDYQGSESSPAFFGGRLFGSNTIGLNLHDVDPTHLSGQFTSTFTDGCTINNPLTIAEGDAGVPPPGGSNGTATATSVLLREYIPSKTPTLTPTFTFTPTWTLTPTPTVTKYFRVTATPSFTPTYNKIG